jgi:nucleoid-associated protein YgaU
MASFEQLKSKYDSVLELIKVSNVRLDNLHQDSETGKLFLKGGAPSEKVINSLWNAIKAVDPNYDDVMAEFSIDSSLPEPVKTYTVQPGDSFWKIAQDQLGNGALYEKIVAANAAKLPKGKDSVIHPGDVLVIPD